MALHSDWHIHTHHSCDEAALAIADLVAAAPAAGVQDNGITDHLNTPYNLPDLEAARQEYLASNPSPHFHFGVEASVVSTWELEQIATGAYPNPVWGLRAGGPPGAPLALGISADDIRRLGIEYVIGGTHWPIYVPLEREAVIRDYHRQYLFLATHPLVTIVAHPWWWMGHWRDDDGCYRSDPWLDNFGKIPQSMHDEFAAAVIEHGKVVEINVAATLMNPAYPDHFADQYLEYLAYLKERGVTFSLASDCHASTYDPPFEAAAEMLARIGIHDEDLWRLPPRPVDQ